MDRQNVIENTKLREIKNIGGTREGIFARIYRVGKLSAKY